MIEDVAESARECLRLARVSRLGAEEAAVMTWEAARRLTEQLGGGIGVEIYSESDQQCGNE